MGDRVEWEAANCPIQFAGPGERMPDGKTIASGYWGIVIGGDTGASIVIEGTPNELTGFARRVNAVVVDAVYAGHVTNVNEEAAR